MATHLVPVLTLAPAAADALSIAGGTYRVLLSSAESGGTGAIIEMLIPSGSGPGPHAHAGLQELFCVVAGEIVVKTPTQTYTAKQGAFVSIPTGGVVHKFTNEAAVMAQLLCIVVPAGLDHFFKEIGIPITVGTFLPPALMTPAARQHLSAIAAIYGQQLFPPDHLA
jgi:quercetin dioxygenase-like cupin family protein